jgi:hypothetical protein
MGKKSKRHPNKLGRNDPCFCGSGEKFKRCCLSYQMTDARFLPVDETRFSPKELEEMEAFHQQVKRDQKAREEALRRELGIYISLFNTVSFQGKRFYLHAGALVAEGHESTTFHEIITRNLQRVLGQKWWDAEIGRPWDKKHYIAQCYQKLSETLRDRGRWELESESVGSMVPDGYMKYLINLAFDIYILSHTNNTPPPDWIARLKSYDQFEGKRYEVAVASIFARIGCDLEYLPDRRGTEKHPEFKATLDVTGETAYVEAKARTKAGALHTKGGFDLKKATRLKLVPLINAALQKNTHGMPYFIFVEANFPENMIKPSMDKHWTEKVIENLGEHMGKPTLDKPFKYNLLAVTNYSYHYDKEEASTRRSSISSVPLYSAISFRDDNMAEKQPGLFSQRIINAVRGYGTVPNL